MELLGLLLLLHENLRVEVVAVMLQMRRKHSGELGDSIEATEVKNDSSCTNLAVSTLRRVPQHHHLPESFYDSRIREPDNLIQGSLMYG